MRAHIGQASCVSRSALALSALLSAHYATRQVVPRYRLIMKAQKIRRQLGGSLSMVDSVPPKPRGMHWKRYERLRQRHDLAARQGLGNDESKPLTARGRDQGVAGLVDVARGHDAGVRASRPQSTTLRPSTWPSLDGPTAALTARRRGRRPRPRRRGLGSCFVGPTFALPQQVREDATR